MSTTILSTLRAEFVAGAKRLEDEINQIVKVLEQKKADFIATNGGIQALDKSIERLASLAEAAVPAAAPAVAVLAPVIEGVFDAPTPHTD